MDTACVTKSGVSSISSCVDFRDTKAYNEQKT